MKHLRVFSGVMLALALAGCGEGSATNGGQIALVTAAGPPPAVLVPEPRPTPTLASKTSAAFDPYTRAPVAGTVNDSFVREPGKLSLDRAVYGRIKRTYQGVPAIARVGSRIWVAWVSETSKLAWEGPGNFIVMVYSDDGGKRWSREFYLTPARPATDHMLGPLFWVAPDGKLWLLYGQAGNSVVLDGQFGVWAAVISNPNGTIPSLEPGFWLADGVPVLPFKVNDAWYLPTDYPYGNARFPARAGKVVFRFDWVGHTMRQAGWVPRSRNADFDESAYVVLKDGSILTQSRSYSGILQSRSPASPFVIPGPRQGYFPIGGFAFSAPQVWGLYPSAPSRHVLIRSPSGRLVMVWNKNTARTDMTIALSSDEGKTWGHLYTFDKRHDVSYPQVDFDPATGDILIVYDRARAGVAQIVLARINEDILAQGKARVKLISVSRLRF